MQAAPSQIAQYAPLNLGFQVLGWLYGEDFGDAICKAVNCGYDTDCTGATLGSILGILAGQQNLPEKWTAPLGEAIATNESWGGIRHASDGPHPVPANLAELTERVCVMAQHVLSAHGRLQDGACVQVDPDPEHLKADEKIRELWEASPLRLDYQEGTIPMTVDYRDTPVCAPGEDKTLLTIVTNPHPDPIRVNCELYTPDGWQARIGRREVTLAPYTSTEISWTLPIPPARSVENTNTLYLALQAQGYAAQPAVPLVLIGARRYRYAGPYTGEDQSTQDLLDQVFEPETLRGPIFSQEGRAGLWNECAAFDNALPFGNILAHGGALYVQGYLWSPIPSQVWMGTATTCPAKLWVNGECLTEASGYRPLRPQYAGQEETGCFARVQLLEGWNEVLLKFARTTTDPAFEGHFLLSTADDLHHGLPQIRWTRLPWDE